MQQRLVDAVLDAQPAPREPSEQPDDLTPREVEVLKLIAEGKSNAEIAEALVVSAATVKTHVNRLFYKTGPRPGPSGALCIRARHLVGARSRCVGRGRLREVEVICQVAEHGAVFTDVGARIAVAVGRRIEALAT